MKKTLLTISLITLFFSSSIFAEDNTKTSKKPEREFSSIFGGKTSDTYISGYGALTGSYSRIKGHNAYFGGFRGGLIVDNFVFGIAGSGLAHPNKRDDFTDSTYTGDKPYINFGYGGALIEYYFAPTNLVHFSIGTTVGGGGLSFSRDDDNDDDHDGDKFFVIEPEINMFINVTRFCRLGVGGSYRHIKGLDNDEFEDKDFSGASVRVIAAFGWF